MNEPSKYRDTIGELLLRYGGGVLIVVGCFIALLKNNPAKNIPFDGTNFMLMGAVSMIYSRLCQIARQYRP